MGAGLLQDLANTSATQNATNNNIYNTTPGLNFNYTSQNAPYWGKYTAPMSIDAINTKLAEQPQYDSKGRLIKKIQKSIDPNQESFDNPSPLPNYSMYITPAQMPDVNAYLPSPNSLLNTMQSYGVPISGAGRYSNSSLLNSLKGK